MKEVNNTKLNEKLELTENKINHKFILYKWNRFTLCDLAVFHLNQLHPNSIQIS